MTQQELQWLRELYKNYIIPGKACGSNAMHCDHWSKILYLDLRAKQYKEILSNDDHACLSIDGMYIDLEFNAFIVDFDWKTRSIDSTAIFKPINPDFKVLRDQIFKYYSKPATEAHHLWHNRVF